MKLWGGRYEVETDALMHQLNRSIGFDARLWGEDLTGSVAWANGLHSAGLLSYEERDAIVSGLEQVRDEWEQGVFLITPEDEDIHSANERRLTELIGAVAGKLHTGRSRNDQIATDIRLYVRAEIERLTASVRTLQASFVEQAERGMGIVLPGYTHLQRAQPILWSHWLLQWFWMLERDVERLQDARKRVNVSPLGAGALAGHSLGVNREAVGAELGFDSVAHNSLDAVSDRDFIVELLSVTALLGVHLSRLAEDLILYASAEFGFVKLDPRYTTGSSLMPQKANPDALELARGKSGRLVGNLVTVLTLLKGIPSTYNKDLQEDKEPLFDTLDTLHALVPVVAGVVATLSPQPERMRAAVEDAMLATELADYLVRRGVPFRQAHHAAGRAVAAAESAKVALRDLPFAEYHTISETFEEDVYNVFNIDYAVNAKAATGGTGRSAVEVQLAEAKARMGY
jgi:argininosuccinate lyase